MADVQQPSSPIQGYFTKEKTDLINGITDEQMTVLLKELEGSPYWPAILRYIQQRLLYVQHSLFSADPVKDPTGMARSQGIMLGLSDMQNMIITLVTPKEDNPDNTVVG